MSGQEAGHTSGAFALREDPAIVKASAKLHCLLAGCVLKPISDPGMLKRFHAC